MTYFFYYLTEDSGNSKERNEVNYLRSIGQVVVVTRGVDTKIKCDRSIKHLNLSRQTNSAVSAYSLWRKVCYLLARPSNSLTDKSFPSRNVYTGSVVIRWLTNTIWPLKYVGFIKMLLPTYENLYFWPFRLARFFVRDKNRSEGRFTRIVVHDALIIRLTKFTPFILMARRSGWRTIANVKSWDNPFYTQFVCAANGYLTWSQSMWTDIKKMQDIKSEAHHAWGPRQFYDFACAEKCDVRAPSIMPETKMVGYAAAFCDTMMAENEVKVIASIAEYLLAKGIDARILFRPYPIVPRSVYAPLLLCPNVEIVDIEGQKTDRFGDGREMIRFGTVEERIKYLSRCNCFLSIATSFTFEAALFGLPVVQYFVPKHKRREKYEGIFFDRLDISDHILNYLLPNLPVTRDVADLATYIISLPLGARFQQKSGNLLSVMGFPLTIQKWNSDQNNFISNVLLD